MTDYCLMCSGEACNLCGAGCWAAPGQVYCEHDVAERHHGEACALAKLDNPEDDS